MRRTDVIPLYDHKSNPVDVNGSDFKGVMAWLVAHGAPEPIVVHEGQLGAGYETIQLVIFPGKGIAATVDGPGMAFEASDLCNNPSEALSAMQIGFGFGPRDKNGDTVIVDYPVTIHPPPPPPPPPVVKPASPIGFPLSAPWGVYYTCSVDSAGIAYQPKDKEVYTDSRGTFTAHRYAQMGNTYGAYWYLPGYALGAGDTPRA